MKENVHQTQCTIHTADATGGLLFRTIMFVQETKLCGHQPCFITCDVI